MPNKTMGSDPKTDKSPLDADTRASCFVQMIVTKPSCYDDRRERTFKKPAYAMISLVGEASDQIGHSIL